MLSKLLSFLAGPPLSSSTPKKTKPTQTEHRRPKPSASVGTAPRRATPPPLPKKQPSPTPAVIAATTLGYGLKKSILTATERRFYQQLLGALPPGTHLCVSVRVADVIDVPDKQADFAQWQTSFNKICSKQFDFVLCEAASFRPLLAIELDDPTHNRKNRRDRDGLLDTIATSVGLPILHVITSNEYNISALREAILRTMHANGQERVKAG